MPHFNQCGKTAVSVLLVGVVVLLLAMAASPALHKAIHHDADKSDHDCAATMFAHGKMDSATIEVPAVIPTVSIEVTSQFVFSVFSPAIENLPAGRAPPSFLLAS
ncbi:MAG TPA: hypothetical protein VGI63_08990 [Verrucomicrobiae bacterium]